MYIHLSCTTYTKIKIYFSHPVVELKIYCLLEQQLYDLTTIQPVLETSSSISLNDI